MTKSFVLDTNVLIHAPTALFSFADNDVVLPITVIEELDRFKTEADRRGMHARQVLREVDALITEGALEKGATMANGGRLKIAFVPKTQVLPQEMDIGRADNQILAVALDLQKTSGEAVFFVSKDVNARIKAYALGLQTRDYEQQKVEYTSLYTGWRDLQVTDEQLAELYAKGKLVPQGVDFFKNEGARLTVQGNDASKPVLCRFNPKQNGLVPIKEGLSAMGIKPRNVEQKFAFDLLLDDDVQLVSLVGQAGSGKTLLALACALEKTMGSAPRYEKLLVARPVIPMGRDIGFMPGGKDQKLSYWMRPIFDNLEFILSKKRPAADRGERGHEDKKLTIEYLQENRILEIEALTYIRGRSIPNQFLIVDEAQNLTPHEIKTIISRAGQGTKIVLTGDPDQIDTPYLDANSNGLTYSVERLKNEPLIGHVLLTKSERSALASVAAKQL
jgi:PhoH-like ATPase